MEDNEIDCMQVYDSASQRQSHLRNYGAKFLLLLHRDARPLRCGVPCGDGGHGPVTPPVADRRAEDTRPADIITPRARGTR